jgi:hypothetical protein
MLKHWPAFTCLLGDGCICLSNNAAERAGLNNLTTAVDEPDDQRSPSNGSHGHMSQVKIVL